MGKTLVESMSCKSLIHKELYRLPFISDFSIMLIVGEGSMTVKREGWTARAHTLYKNQ